ncbi:MAG: hypothetical protein AB8B86_21270 [Pseudomonadales bacterium]
MLPASWWQDKSDTQTPQLWEYNPSRANNFEVIELKDQVLVPILGTNDNQASEWTGGNNLLGSGPVADMSSSAIAMTIDWDVNDSVKLTSITSFNDFDNNSQYTND